MKRIKAINGYTIYEATEKDTRKYNVEAGCFYIYFSSDIREYGLSNSYWDFEAGNIQEAIDWCSCCNYATAKEMVEATTTAASFEEIELIEEMLNAGLSQLEIEEMEELEDCNFVGIYDTEEIIQNYNDSFKHFFTLAVSPIQLDFSKICNIYMVEDNEYKYLCTIRK
jgi:hypothetical protein